ARVATSFIRAICRLLKPSRRQRTSAKARRSMPARSRPGRTTTHCSRREPLTLSCAGACDLGPARELALDERRDCLGAGVERIVALLAQRFDRVGAVHRFPCGIGELLDYPTG